MADIQNNIRQFLVEVFATAVTQGASGGLTPTTTSAPIQPTPPAQPTPVSLPTSSLTQADAMLVVSPIVAQLSRIATALEGKPAPVPVPVPSPTPTPTPVPPVAPPADGDWQKWFTELWFERDGPQSWPVGNGAPWPPPAQAFLKSLEPTLNAANVMLSPANASGDLTKIGIPMPGNNGITDGNNRQWIRVGWGEGHLVWVG